MQQISVALVVYDHLAPGEEDSRLARAAERVWLPLVEALTEAPHARLSMHISGALGDWLEEHRPALLDGIAALVARNQVELLAGSPVGAALQSLPDRDALAHLQGSLQWLQQRFDSQTRGAWLGAGGWDPALPRVLARAGIRYTFIDEGLMGPSGGPPSTTGGWFVTSREGAAVGVLPLDDRLPALMPWALPRYCAFELKERAAEGRRFLVAAVPAEDLGLRHGSGRWCWRGERGWVSGLLRMLRNQASWLKTVLPSQIVDGVRPSGRVTATAGTSFAQGRSALPAPLGRTWSTTRRDLASGFDPMLQRLRPFLVGPPWEAYLSRRDEANQLHKRMLRSSAAVYRLRRKLRSQRDSELSRTYEQARAWLYSGQGGAVLHGSPTGGPDRPDLRHATWKALVTAEHLALQGLGEGRQLRHQIQDHDCDGYREVLLHHALYTCMVRPSMGGALGELSVWKAGNLVNALARLEETWHDRLAFSAALPAIVEPGRRDDAGNSLLGDEDDELIDEEDSQDETSSTVYTDSLEQVALPEPPSLPVPLRGLEDCLSVDRHRRLLFQEHFLGPGTTLDNLRRDQHPQQGDFLDAPYALLSAEKHSGDEVHVALAREGIVDVDGTQHLVRVRKRYVFHQDSPVIDLSYEVSNRIREPVRTRFATELNLGLDGRTQGRFLHSGDRRSFLDRDGTWAEVTDLALVLPDAGLRVHLWSAEPGTLFFYQVRSVVESCEGYEPAHQGTCLVLAWDLELWGEEKRRFDLFLTLEQLESAAPRKARSAR